MKLLNLEEPELEFGGSQPHVDIRYGLRDYGPLDLMSDLAPKAIRIGLVGTSESVEGLERWLAHCSKGIDSKPSRQPHLFTSFPSADGRTAFNCQLLTGPSLSRTIGRHELLRIGTLPDTEERIKKAVQLFASEIEYLSENFRLDVIACAFPEELIEILDDPKQSTSFNFHDLLKARIMTSRIPIQIVLPSLYDESKAKKQRGTGLARTLQDEATRAWNIYSALYYKAGGTPWRLRRDSRALDTCFVGLSFYRSIDGQSVSTSIAQVFNERGEGVVIRGAVADLSSDDKQPHLTEEDSFELLVSALSRYKQEHRNHPARLVVHKTSSFSEGELSGLQQALANADISTYDFLHLRPSDIRLYRAGVYPTLRGTMLELSDEEFILYTRGSVPFFETYPGMYVPRPTFVNVAYTDQTSRFLASEILALTKLNWNSTQFDGRDPVTIRASRQVGAILRFCEPNQPIAPRYSFYM